MNRPYITWAVLAACAALIVGAMAWATSKALDLEAKQAEAESAAELEERVRLALSRIDTAASGFMVRENQRPPHYFKAFFEPEDVYTNKLQVVGKGIVLQPSPLLDKVPDFVRLHFEVLTNRSVHSPQVPVGNQRDLAEQSGISREILDKSAAELKTLRALLAVPAGPGAVGPTNLDYFCTACAAPEAVWNTPPREQVMEVEAAVNSARNNSGDNNVRRSLKYQKDWSLAEKVKRAEGYNESVQQAVAQGVRSNFSQAANAPAVDDEDASPGAPGTVQVGAEVTPFLPVWLSGELFAVRQVTRGAEVRYQGVWLRSAQLADHLVATVVDLLPAAGLERIESVSATNLSAAFDPGLEELSNDPRSLVTLPWRLIPGELPVVAIEPWTPLRLSLAVGWAALLLALVAAALLMRGVMKLSDRRATFVSSVTHELRTPLTTFHLYADMLAEDMVQDEKKRKSYLKTMRHEATRLNHLIENVLAYSRIERGSARARHEKIRLADLVGRLRPRLDDRVGKENAKLQIEEDDRNESVEIDTDLTAVEQIVFNLVDNACKYGLPDEGDRVVRLRASNGGHRAKIEVCDEGGGIARSDVKKLFRAFHKSAREAAHSKPGVGLGLALSRRLARALGGDLRLDTNANAGACFVLELPLAEN